MTSLKPALVAASALLITFSAILVAQQRPASVEIVGHIVKPVKVDATPERIAGLKLPPGYKVSVFAEGLGKPRMLSVASGGTVYVTRRDPGDIVMLRDTDHDGRADERRIAVRRPMLHGLAFKDKRAYFVGVTDVFAADVAADGTFTNITRLANDLPEGGQHADRTIAVGPDGDLYLTVGSTCNECEETNPENATMLKMTADGSSRQIFASGLRNTIGFDWNPASHQLFGWDHGIDWLGDDAQPEELNQIQEGKQYGWPYVFARSEINPHNNEPPGEITAEQWASLSVEPVLTYTAHAAPMQMRFYTGNRFPQADGPVMFVAMHGSWNRQQPSGYEVVRVTFKDGAPGKAESFLSGFVKTEQGQPTMFGRPTGIAIAADGALLVGDELNGMIYRVVYDGSATSTRAEPTPPRPAPESTADTRGVVANNQLAITRTETAAGGSLSVTSSAFTSDGAIPTPYSQYGERFSPALTWTSAPSGTQSFAVLIEDPDAKQPKPYVHWVLYNLPASVTALHESVPGLPRLKDLGGALQGRNSRGSIGYTGPRPPETDQPHHYHFEVFALDTTLTLDPGAEREALLTAMRGHVLGRGEVVGTFQKPR